MKTPTDTSARPELITLAAAAVLVGVTVPTIRSYITTGRLTGFRLGPRMIRVDRTQVVTLWVPVAAKPISIPDQASTGE